MSLRSPRAAATAPTVAIVGGGMSGIAAAVKLVRSGVRTFTIYERDDGLGGTWWVNRYPGAEVDVASHLYSYSFHRFDWSRTHARQEEIQRYLEDVVDRFDLRSHFRFGVTVERATWDEQAAGYDLDLAGGAHVHCDVLISALGFLSEPAFPQWPGLDTFAGPVFHTSRWEPDHDLTDKRVAVVGTGSTATQLVPELVGAADHITVFQREPGWILPKGERDFTEEERRRLRRPWNHWRHRLKLHWQIERGQFRAAIYRPHTKLNAAREELCRTFIARSFADRPDLATALTPTYPFPGKRPVLCSTFYRALRADNVTLVPKAVASVTADAVVDADGDKHPTDVLVLATGFQPANYLASLEIVGRHGRSIHDTWAGEPEAFLGITVPGFPNLYLLYGPNTNGGEIVFFLERQAEWAARAVRRMARTRVRAIEVRPVFNTVYNRWLQRAMRDTAWTVSRNYYKAASGRIVTQWPFGCVLYGVLTSLTSRISSTAHR